MVGDTAMKNVLFLMMAALVLAGCEKAIVADDDYSDGGDRGGNVVLTAAVVQHHTRQTRGAEELALSDVCGRLNVAVFDVDGKKVKTVSQVVSDAGYGTVSLSLVAGHYALVAVGHNCTGSATITNAEKVTFPNNKVTDTFCYYGFLDVTGEKQDVGISLQRSVAMIRLKMTGGLDRQDVASLKFYYLGGSSTYSPADGFGCVNSKQTEVRAWNTDGIYEVYTLPHSTDDVITKMTITAMDAGDNVLGEWTLENIPVTMNHITTYSGDLLGGGGGAVMVSIGVDAEWGGEYNYTF